MQRTLSVFLRFLVPIRYLQQHSGLGINRSTYGCYSLLRHKRVLLTKTLVAIEWWRKSHNNFRIPYSLALSTNR